MYSIATFISILVFLLPAAFYAGHAAAMSSPGCSLRHLQPNLNIGRAVSGGGVGRQLSHDMAAESIGQTADPSESSFYVHLPCPNDQLCFHSEGRLQVQTLLEIVFKYFLIEETER